MGDEVRSLHELAGCFHGQVPAVLVTASAAGEPNVTYISKVQLVDDERVALSNQFFSKSARNLVENPHASLIVVDAGTVDEYRLAIAYERTERRGPTFDAMRAEVDAIAAMTGMQDVFRLQSADIYRVTRIDVIRRWVADDPIRLPTGPDPSRIPGDGAGLGALCARISRARDLDTLVRVVVDGLAELLGHEHSILLLLDEDGTQLFTIASHGYPAEGVGSEVPVGEGIVGMAAAQARTIRLGNFAQLAKYGRAVRQRFEEEGDIRPGRRIPLPDMPDVQSRLAVPAMALGQVIGVLGVESARRDEYVDADEAALSVVASLVASSVEAIRAEERMAQALAARPGPISSSTPSPPPVTDPSPDESPSNHAPPGLRSPAPPASPVATHVRWFAVDGSTFLDGDYLIKGVAGRILWSLLRQHDAEGRTEFTNREVRLDPTLDLPDFRDNFESRLILLKRRLEEREAPIRIEKTGRGRFRLAVATSLRLEEMPAPE